MFVNQEEIKPELRWSRQEIIRSISSEHQVDVLVIGGGIHGAAVARLAAFNGLKTVLLETSDYASATSSRSSKLAHGGLRYLAMGDFQQVFESVKAREELYRAAPHLVHPWPFLIPVRAGDWLTRLKLQVALPLYSYFSSSGAARTSWVPSTDALTGLAFGRGVKSLSGCFRYYDGIMDDARLVIETITAARQEGARCLNYASVDSVRQLDTDQVEVGWTDRRTDTKYTSRAGVVVNCAGPWAPAAGRLKPLSGKVRYSQGSHLLFDYPWHQPALFMPMEGKNRYYFVLPHPGGTLVGTTEREITGELPLHPFPAPDEIREILSRVSRDLPDHQLNAETLYHGFAGIRTLPLRDRSGDVSRLSRRHIWEFNGGMLTLYGGKYTSAFWTAYEGLKLVQERSRRRFELVDVRERPLPGCFGASEAFEKIGKKIPAQAQGDALRNAFRIHGGRISSFEDQPEALQVLGEKMLRGTVELALQVEQVETVEDLMRRRLGLELSPGYGEDILCEIQRICHEIRPDISFAEEADLYRERLVSMKSALVQASISA